MANAKYTYNIKLLNTEIIRINADECELANANVPPNAQYEFNDDDEDDPHALVPFHNVLWITREEAAK